MSVIVLTYHACNILGNDYADNDHVALAEDLQTLADHGFALVSLGDAVAAGLSGTDKSLVALTFDDGPVFDFEDLEHPSCGFQKSFYRILDEFAQGSGTTPKAASFVITSPEARDEMDRVDFGARDWWHDRWWRPARDSGVIEIENHSWDHNHPSLSKTAHKENVRGRFDTIDTFDECELELRQASDYIEASAGRRPRFFAYPWGQASDYLRREYLPRFGEQLGLTAAFGIEPGRLDRNSERWYLPRFVCGQHWRSSAELVDLLEGKQ